MKIFLSTINDAAVFTNKCAKYKEDIDVIAGHTKFDAKSLTVNVNLVGNKDLSVNMLTDDEEKRKNFENDIKLWKTGE